MGAQVKVEKREIEFLSARDGEDSAISKSAAPSSPHRKTRGAKVSGKM